MIDSDTGLRPVREMTSVLRMWSCQHVNYKKTNCFELNINNMKRKCNQLSTAT